MKIYGPYTRKDGRQHIIKYENGKRTTQSYPRYLMEQKLGRKLLPNEEVDHKDNDFTNNDLNNLQILTGTANKLKEMNREHRKAKLYIGTCSICGVEFTKSLAQVKHNRKQTKSGPFCSRKCAGIHNTNIQYNK